MKKILCIVLILCVLVLPGCTKKTAAEVPELMPPVGVSMDTAVVTRKDIDKKVVYTGVVEPQVQELYFEMDGILEVLKVNYGDAVKKGDVLAILDQEELEKQVEELEKQIAYKQKTNAYTNQQLQYDISICQAELNQLKANEAADAEIQMKKLDMEEKNLKLSQTKESQNLELDQLNSRLDKLQQEIGTNTLTAPCDGTIVYVADSVAVGRGISAFAPILYIADDSDLHISCQEINAYTLENADSVYAKIGDKEYTITLQPYDREEYMALLLAGGDPQSHFSIDNIDETIQAGDYVVIMLTSLTHEDTLVIPANAVYADEMGSFVYKVVDGRRERCNVKTGVITNIEAQIVEGLEEGDVVYVQE